MVGSMANTGIKENVERLCMAQKWPRSLNGQAVADCTYCTLLFLKSIYICMFTVNLSSISISDHFGGTVSRRCNYMASNSA